MELITGKNKEQFEKWFKTNKPKILINNPTPNSCFYAYEFNLQIGIYLAYYKEVHNIDMAINIVTVKETFKSMNKAVNITMKKTQL